MSDENRQPASQDQRWFTNHSDSIASATAEPNLLVYPISFRRQLTLRFIIVFLSGYRGVRCSKGGLHAETRTSKEENKNGRPWVRGTSSSFVGFKEGVKSQ